MYSELKTIPPIACQNPAFTAFATLQRISVIKVRKLTEIRHIATIFGSRCIRRIYMLCVQ